MKRSACMAAAAIIGGTVIGFGCSSSPAPEKPAEQAALASDSTASLDAFKSQDPSLQELMDKAVGYAVFPDVGKGGFIAGGSYGKGEVFEGGRKVGYADITQATFGLQAGGQSFSELILFLKPEELAKFKGEEFTLAGNVSAVAMKSGAARTADTSKGIVVFTHAKSGLMAEASVGGQRFRFRPISAAPTTQPRA